MYTFGQKSQLELLLKKLLPHTKIFSESQHVGKVTCKCNKKRSRDDQWPYIVAHFLYF